MGPSGPTVAVYRSHSRQPCAEQALVLRAVGIKCRIQRDSGEHVLVVANEDAAQARSQLDAYAHENREAVDDDTVLARLSEGWSGVLVYASVLSVVAICSSQNLFDVDWLNAGRTSATLIRGGQYWRCVTALTLHVDGAHLVANLVVGGMFGLFAAQVLGGGLAWLSIVIGGAAGNAINAWIRPGEHYSAGASTAVFAALGIGAAFAWTQRRSGSAMSLRRWAPLIAGVVLLGYLGAGGARTDVGAHVAGFCSGLFLGTLYGKLGRRIRLRYRWQFALAFSALIVLVFAWTLALLSRVS